MMWGGAVVIEDGRPIFVQIAEQIENDIIEGALPEEGQVPSTNEFAAFHRINPATAGKGVNVLVENGTLYKKRGIGMFVSTGARERLLAERRTRFSEQYLRPLLTEAAKLGITREQVADMLGDAPRSAPAPASTHAPTSAPASTLQEDES